MKRMNAFKVTLVLWVVILIGSSFVITGCRHQVNTANPKVVFANTLLAAADALDVVATTNLTVDKVLEGLKAQEPDYYTKLQPVLKSVAIVNDKAIAAVRAAQAGDTSVDWRTAILAVVDAAGKDDLANFGFKNPNSKAKIQIALASFKLALTTLTNSFGGK